MQAAKQAHEARSREAELAEAYAEARALRAAMKGITQVPTGYPLAIRLRAKAARAYARLGDREKFETLFAEARSLHDQMPTQAPVRFTLDTTMASYPCTSQPLPGQLNRQGSDRSPRPGHRR